jgi:hypothetical protein
MAAKYAGTVNSVARPYGSVWDIGAYELAPGLIFAAGFKFGTTDLWWVDIP